MSSRLSFSRCSCSSLIQRTFASLDTAKFKLIRRVLKLKERRYIHSTEQRFPYDNPEIWGWKLQFFWSRHLEKDSQRTSSLDSSAINSSAALFISLVFARFNLSHDIFPGPRPSVSRLSTAPATRVKLVNSVRHTMFKSDLQLVARGHVDLSTFPGRVFYRCIPYTSTHKTRLRAPVCEQKIQQCT